MFLPKASPMLSMDFIRANRADVERAIRDKGVGIDLDALIALDAEVRGAKGEIEALRASRNAISARFKDAAPQDRAELGAEAKAAGARASELEQALSAKETELRGLTMGLPGVPWTGAPVGPNEDSNVVVRTEGTVPSFDFAPLDHVALIEKNDWAELSRIVQVSGSRTYCLKGRLALLETKLMGWALEQIAGAGSPRSRCRRSRARPRSSTRGNFPGMSRKPMPCPMTMRGWRGPPRSR